MFSKDIKGAGEVVSRDMQVGDFTKIDVGGAFVVSYKRGDCAVSVEMQENLFEHLDIAVKHGKLSVNFKSGKNISTGKSPHVYISAPVLDAIALSGAASTADWDKISAESFSISASGAAGINISLEAERLDLDASGAVTVKLSGSVGAAKMVASGASNIKAGDLEIKDAKINVSGASNAHVACSGSLDAEVSGASNMRYTGDASVNQRVSGASSIKRG